METATMDLALAGRVREYAACDDLRLVAMKSAAAILFSLIGLAVAVLVVGLVTGGYVRRVECPRVNGSTETDWTFRYQQVLPYLGYERTGCRVTSATRVVLDKVGIWDLGPSLKENTAVDHTGEYPVGFLTTAIRGCVSGGESREFCGCAMPEAMRRLAPSDLQLMQGATRYDQLPDRLAGDLRALEGAVERDCR